MRFSALVLMAAGCAGHGNAADAPRDGSVVSGAENAAGAGQAASGVVAGPDAAAAVPARRAEHVVFRLGDNRVLAHQMAADGGLFVAAGSAGFAKYVRFGMPALRWGLQRRRDGVGVAVADRLASIEVPLTAAQAKGTRALSMQVYSPAARRFTVKINGRKASAAKIELAAGWQRLELPIAAGRLTAGENFLTFESGRGGDPELASLHFQMAKGKGGAASAAALSGKTDGTESVAALSGNPDGATPVRYDAADDAFVLQAGAGLAWYVLVPAGAELVADEVEGEGCRVEVTARGGDGVTVTGALAGRGAGVDLAKLAGAVVRLELAAAGCAEARLRGGAVTLPGEPPAVSLAGKAPRYIVLWVMDALRADRLRPFQTGARAEVPALERLAATGAVFRQFYVQGNESQTSHSSFWTSLYPAVHNVRTAGPKGAWRIDRKMPVIGELLRAAGYQTIGITGNGMVTDSGGYARGFGFFRNMMREKGIRNGVLPGGRVLGAAVEQLAEARSGPVFLFLGTIDTHGPWMGHQPWLDRYDRDYRGVHQDYVNMWELGVAAGRMGCTVVPPAREIARIRAIYDSAVSYQDELLGKLVAQLESWGIAEQTMIVVTADHGEELFEEDRCGHGASLRETLVRVPLLIHYPPLFPGGVVDEGAEGIDLLPTILDAIDADPPAGAQGASLLPLAHGVGRGWVRPSYASQYEYAHAMRLGRWKARIGPSGIPDIYDLERDPQERQSLAATRPIERRFLTDAFSTFLVYRRIWNKQRWGVVSNMTAQGAAALESPP